MNNELIRCICCQEGNYKNTKKLLSIVIFTKKHGKVIKENQFQCQNKTINR